MLKARAGDALIFGLSAENVKRLQQGKPISVDLTSLGLPAGRVLIFYGETEDEMARELMAVLDKGPRGVPHDE